MLEDVRREIHPKKGVCLQGSLEIVQAEIDCPLLRLRDQTTLALVVISFSYLDRVETVSLFTRADVVFKNLWRGQVGKRIRSRLPTMQVVQPHILGSKVTRGV